MVLCLYFNYFRNLEILNKKKNLFAMNADRISEREMIEKQQKIQEKYLAEISNLCKDMVAYTVLTNTFNGEYDSKVIFSKELFQNRLISDKKKLDRWADIDNEIGEEGDGSIYVIQSLLVSDLTALLPTEEVGMTIREVILNNSIIRNRNMTCQELENIRDTDYESYTQLIDSTNPEEYLPIFREEILKNIRFIDIDKLLLMAGYRIESSMESGFVKGKDGQTLYHLVRYIKEKIENKKISFKEELQAQKTYDPIEVEYSYEELEKFVKRFIKEEYISKEQIEEGRKKILNGETTLEDLELPFFNLLDINEDEIEQIMYNSNENFIFGIKVLELSESDIQTRLIEYPKMISLSLINFLYNNDSISIDTIIYLYSNILISSEFFKEFSKDKDIFSEINLQKINELYTEIKSSKGAEDEKKNRLAAGAGVGGVPVRLRPGAAGKIRPYYCPAGQRRF